MVSLRDATDLLPRNAGKKLHHSTIWRWCNRGLRGVRLESVRIGGTAFTSREALNRFIAALSADDAARAPSPASRSRQHQQAKRELEPAGI